MRVFRKDQRSTLETEIVAFEARERELTRRQSDLGSEIAQAQAKIRKVLVEGDVADQATTAKLEEKSRTLSGKKLR